MYAPPIRRTYCQKNSNQYNSIYNAVLSVADINLPPEYDFPYFDAFNRCVMRKILSIHFLYYEDLDSFLDNCCEEISFNDCHQKYKKYTKNCLLEHGNIFLDLYLLALENKAYI